MRCRWDVLSVANKAKKAAAAAAELIHATSLIFGLSQRTTIFKGSKLLLLLHVRAIGVLGAMESEPCCHMQLGAGDRGPAHRHCKA